jgi:hypothetical protein
MMRSKTQEMLVEEFQAIAPGRQEPGESAVERVGGPENAARSTSAAAADGTSGDATVGTPFADLVSSGSGAAPQPSASVSGGGNTAATIVSTIFKSGLGLIPLAGELLGMLGGGGTQAEPKPLKYAMPAPIGFEAADTASGVTEADYDQMGMPRLYDAMTTPGGAPSGASAGESGSASAGGASSAAAAPQVTVNVQAMDARSFLDHSSEIAQAVRDAMLNMSSINDVVNEL